jgi:hypothetical protein
MLLLLLALVVLVWWLNDLMSKVEKKAPPPVKQEPLVVAPDLSDADKPADIFYGTIPTATPQIDPTNQQLADALNAPGKTVHDDLQVLDQFIDLYRRAFKSGNPTGENMDITAYLTGTANPKQPGRVFPAKHNAIRQGQIVDRWGTPYCFHPLSAFKMEIRSAGPDRSLYTKDDVVINQ